MTKKLEDILNLPNVKEAFAQADAKEKTKDQKKHYSILRNLELSMEHKKLERPKTDEQKIKSGELLDPTSTIKQQTIWAKNFCKKFFGEEFKGFKNLEKGMF